MYIENLYKYKFYILDKKNKLSFSDENRKIIEDFLLDIFGEKKVCCYYNSDQKNRYSGISSLVYLLPNIDEKRLNLFFTKLYPMFINENYEITVTDLEKGNPRNLSKLVKREYRFSEIFGNTFQGEGNYTGVNTVWYRSWGCNFNCNGFGQENPHDASSWKLDYIDIDPSDYKKMEDLPVFKRGCDSSYSWSKKFFKLSKKARASEIVDMIENFLVNQFNTEKSFFHKKSKQWIHMAFTGGEPMLSQSALLGILIEFFYRYNMPRNVTVETNGTIDIRPELKEFISELYSKKEAKDDLGFSVLDKDKNKIKSMYNFYDREWFWSVSPKLSLSGEKWEDAIKPKVVKKYYDVSNKGQLKFVVDGSEKIWDEVERAVELYRNEGIDWNVWIMPVGANKEDQEKIQAEISEEALRRGFYVAARVHCWVFGNKIGK